ncbi:MAG: hypothetical protein LBR81_03175 [Prevotellaceae bacterium]|jgi:hypothetical protein|nr:hypothetical protein [Prevotellaceae bacterium]
MKTLYFLDVEEGNIAQRDLFNAATKAKFDVRKTIENLGIKTIIVRKNTTPYKFVNTVIDFLRVVVLFVKILFVVRQNSVLLLQRRFSHIKLLLISKALKLKHSELCILIHDINCLRFDKNKGTKRELSEIKNFNLADSLIVHTPAMGKKMKEIGITPKQYPLYLFDYYTDNSPANQIVAKNEVVFAGNLGKSEFLKLLNNYHFEKIKFNLYGFEKPAFITNENLRYFGRFQANHISDIQGGWGLVWDGSSVETCDGILGDYLRYNSSHKSSLYLVAELPLIIWSQSSLRSFVEERNIGIIVDSIEEIEEKISSMTDDEYQILKNNAKTISAELKAGKMLERILLLLVA